MDNVVIVGAARTPIGRFLGSLARTPAPDMGAVAIRGALDRAGVATAEVNEVIMGHVLSAGVGMGPARQAAIKAGVPVGASAFTVNKVCASGMSAVVIGAQEILTDGADVVVAGGMENMSLAPHLLVNSRTGIRLGEAELVDSAVHDGLWCAWENRHMGSSAEEIARKYGITREEQDEFALESHRKAVATIDAGEFRREIVPVTVRQRNGAILVDTDEGPRRDTSFNALARLTPVFENGGTVTAGNAPGLCDGAAVLVLTSPELARRQGWPSRARITAWADASLEPRWVFDAPPEAVKKLLERTGLTIRDFDLIEVNEAFSAQVLANERRLEWDRDRVNVRGGAVALGHPIGASGARILVTLLHALEDKSLTRGLAVLCHGGGGAVAMAIERSNE
jgi:acetyl-CoA C-acetyltransferase